MLVIFLKAALILASHFVSVLGGMAATCSGYAIVGIIFVLIPIVTIGAPAFVLLIWSSIVSSFSLLFLIWEPQEPSISKYTPSDLMTLFLVGTSLGTILPFVEATSSFHLRGVGSPLSTFAEKHSDFSLCRSTPWNSQKVSHIFTSSCIAPFDPVVQVASSINMFPISSATSLILVDLSLSK